jgi:hypothetical protein
VCGSLIINSTWFKSAGVILLFINEIKSISCTWFSLSTIIMKW